MTSPTAVIELVLDEARQIVRAGGALEELTGYSAAEVVGHFWLHFFRPIFPDDRPAEGIDPARRSETEAPAQLELYQIGCLVTQITSKQGEPRFIYWPDVLQHDVLQWTSATHRSLGERTLLGYDITALHQLQRRQLLESRQAGMAQLAQGITHESRNALQRGQACLEELEQRIAGNAAALDMARRVQHSFDLLTKLFRETERFASPFQPKLQPCNLLEVCREAWNSLTALRGEHPSELIEVPVGYSHMVSGDRGLLVDAFRRIFENSLAASREMLRVTISTEKRADLKWEGGSPSEGIVLRIADNGSGIDPRHRPRIFEPFFSTRPRAFGLGLPIAARQLAAHGWKISLGEDRDPGIELVIAIPR